MKPNNPRTNDERKLFIEYDDRNADMFDILENSLILKSQGYLLG